MEAPFSFRRFGQPQGEIEQRRSMIEERAAAGFRAAQTPSLGGSPEMVGAGANAGDLPQLSTVDEPRERLHVRAIPMVVGNADGTVDARGGGQDALDPPRRERQRALAQHVHSGREGAQHVRLVKVVGRGDDYRVERVDLEQILDVRERVRRAEPIGECARLRPIIVADAHELHAAHLRQHRQMGQLRDRAGADDPQPHRLLHERGVWPAPAPPPPRKRPK